MIGRPVQLNILSWLDISKVLLVGHRWVNIASHNVGISTYRKLETAWVLVRPTHSATIQQAMRQAAEWSNNIKHGRESSLLSALLTPITK